MRRTNTFCIKFNGDNGRVLQLADDCARLWNAVNYRRRQSFFSGEIDWNTDDEYREFAPTIGSATAQQIIRKNNQAWKSFFALLKRKKADNLPSHIKNVRPPRYWKDRNMGRRRLIILIRNDCYKIEGRRIKLPKKIKGRIFGKPKWNGKQGTLEIQYDELRKRWYAHQPVGAEPLHQPMGDKRAYIDLGVRCIITGYIEGERQALTYDGTPLLTDWWYWNKQIAGHKSTLATVNGRKTSRRLKKLYRTRRLRFRQEINTYIHRFVERCWALGVSEIVAGDLTNIRNNGEKWSRKSSAMVNNFWNHKYITDRLRYTAENFGIILTLEDERGTSSRCPWCGGTENTRRGRLFKCLSCGIEAHRDVVGALNIGLVHGGLNLREGDINRVMAHPLVASPSHQRKATTEESHVL